MATGAYWSMILLRDVVKLGGGKGGALGKTSIELIIFPALYSLIVPLNLRRERF